MTLDPWALARTNSNTYEMWQHEVANGDTLLGFAAWLEKQDACLDCGNGEGGVYGTITLGLCQPCRLGHLLVAEDGPSA